MKKKCAGNNKIYCYTKAQLLKIVRVRARNINVDNKTSRSELVRLAKKYTLQPKDKDENGYITSTDIYNVMEQYDGDNGFTFIGIYDIIKEIESFKKIISSKFNRFETFGVIFWHDYHWIALWINKSSRHLIYMDSETINGIKYLHICPLIQNYIKPKLFKLVKKKLRIDYNIYDIQSDNYNCGVYVIDFLISMISGMQYNTWLENIGINIEKRRNELFK